MDVGEGVGGSGAILYIAIKSRIVEIVEKSEGTVVGRGHVPGMVEC